MKNALPPRFWLLLPMPRFPNQRFTGVVKTAALQVCQVLLCSRDWAHASDIKPVILVNIIRTYQDYCYIHDTQGFACRNGFGHATPQTLNPVL